MNKMVGGMPSVSLKKNLKYHFRFSFGGGSEMSEVFEVSGVSDVSEASEVSGASGGNGRGGTTIRSESRGAKLTISVITRSRDFNCAGIPPGNLNIRAWARDCCGDCRLLVSHLGVG
jgi:hypothetical protein